jgi:hypothetical protein
MGSDLEKHKKANEEREKERNHIIRFTSSGRMGTAAASTFIMRLEENRRTKSGTWFYYLMGRRVSLLPGHVDVITIQIVSYIFVNYSCLGRRL